MDWSEKRVLVTGSSGFLGSHLLSHLKKVGVKNIVVPSSKEYDLRKSENCRNVVRDIDIVFNIAAHVGGIGLNRDKPGELFYDNLMMGTQLLHEAKNASVEKFVALGTVCSYPKFSQIPFTETSIWDGYPEETNAPYGLAKKMLLVQSQAYRQQYNFKSVVIIPTNLYGPDDHFEPSSSHVIPALIKKVMDAIDNHGSSEEISIAELTKLICELLDYNGNIVWDKTKPNGQPRRCVSYQRAKEKIGFEPTTKLKDGLGKTIEWFTENQEKNLIKN